MSAAPAFPPPTTRPVPKPVTIGGPRFELLGGEEAVAQRRRATLTLSLTVHTVMVAFILITPLLLEPALPSVSDAVRAFFVTPRDIAPPPPPPPPPAAGARVARTTAAPKVQPPPSAFIAPIEVPDEIKLDDALDLGVEGGVPGGVEGGVEGGVLGGVVGGLPTEMPAPPVPRVRIGGQIVAPKLVHRVEPVYPPLAMQARAQGIIILEAIVDTKGHVKEVQVLRGSELFNDAAVAAVRQWRYQPLLLNGAPTEFVLTVTLFFRLTTPVGPLPSS